MSGKIKVVTEVKLVQESKVIPTIESIIVCTK